MNCPCCSQLSFEQCCKPFIEGTQIPSTPEQLMRSRYTAFHNQEARYLMMTSSDKLKLHLTEVDLLESAKACQFLKLTVIDAQDNWVEFKADILMNDVLSPLHEKSTFIRNEDGNWRYDAGELYVTKEIKIKRNDPCPCGSGKKYKKCHSS